MFQRAAIAAVGATALVASAAWTDGDLGCDHMNNDLSSFTQKTNLTSECAAACAAAPSCQGWVFGQVSLAFRA